MKKFVQALIRVFFGKGKKPTPRTNGVPHKAARRMAKEQKIGSVIHLYHKINVAILELSKPLKVGDTIRFMGSTTDATQTVASLQVNHAAVEKANKGEQVGLLLAKGVVVREGDGVYWAQ